MRKVFYVLMAVIGVLTGFIYGGSPPPSPHRWERGKTGDTVRVVLDTGSVSDTFYVIHVSPNKWQVQGGNDDTVIVGIDGRVTMFDSIAFSGESWSVYYTDADGRLKGVPLGAAGLVLKSNGASAAPSWQTDATSGGAAGIWDSISDGAAGVDSFALVARSFDTAMAMVVDTAADSTLVTFQQAEGMKVRFRNIDMLETDSVTAPGGAAVVIGDIGPAQIDTVDAITLMADSMMYTGKSWSLIYIDANGVMIPIGLGASGEVLKSNGPTSAPSWQADAGGGGGTQDSIAWDSAGNATNPGYTYPTMIRPGGGIALTVDTDSGYIHVKPGSGIDTSSGLVKVKPGTGIDTTGGTINHTAHTGDVTGATALTIGTDKVLESHLKAVDAAADEDFLTYEVTVGDFEWHSIADVEPNFTLSNIGGSVTDAQVPDNITITKANDVDTAGTDISTALGNRVSRNGDEISDSLSIDTLRVDSALYIPAKTAPVQTQEGSIAWDSDDDVLIVGAGLTARTILPSNQFTGDMTSTTTGVVTIQDNAVQESDLDITNAKTQGNALVGGSGDNLTYSDLNITTSGSNVQLTASGTPTVVEVGTAGHAQIDSLFTLKAWRGLEGDSSVVDSELVTRGEMRNYQVVTPHWIGGQADGKDSVSLSIGGNKGGAVYLCRDSSILTAASDTVNDTIYFAFTMPEWANTVDSIVLVMEGKNATADSAEVNGVDLMGHKSGALIPDSAYYSDNTARNNTSPTRYVYAVGNSDLTGKDMAAIRVRTTLGRNGVGVIYFYQVYAIVSD